jgi:hypothetical protein
MRRQIEAQRKNAGLASVTVWKKLQNPFALVVQGFLIGGLFLWTTQSDATPRGPVPASAASTLSALH